MAVLRTRVTGPVMLPDGSPAPNGSKVIFRLRSWDRQGGALIMKGPEEAVVVGGVIDKTLNRTSASERGTPYDVICTYPNAAARGQWLEETLGSISLTGPGPVALADLLALPAPIPNVPDALAQALGAAAGASVDAGRAEDAVEVVQGLRDEVVDLAQFPLAKGYATRAQAEASTEDLSMYGALQTLGYYLPGDGGGAAYLRDTGPSPGSLLVNGTHWRLHSLPGNAYSPLMFGAAGDGVANDTVALSAWALKLRSEGDAGRSVTGFVPAGHVFLSALTILLGSNVTFSGGGTLAPHASLPDNQLLIAMQRRSAGAGNFSNKNVHLRDITVDGRMREVTEAPTLQNLVRLESIENVSVEGCTFKSHRRGLLIIMGCKGVTATGNRFTDWGMLAPSDDPETGTGDGGSALFVGKNYIAGDNTDSQFVSVTGNTFWAGRWSGITCYADGAAITGNTLDGCAEAAIFCRSDAGGGITRNITISGNSINNTWKILVDATSILANMINGVVSGNSVFNGQGPGIQVGEGANNVSIDGNTIVDTMRAPFATAYPLLGQITLRNRETPADPVNVRIINNLVLDTASPRQAPRGISVYHTNGPATLMHGIAIKGNRIINSSIDAADNLIIDPAVVGNHWEVGDNYGGRVSYGVQSEQMVHRSLAALDFPSIAAGASANIDITIAPVIPMATTDRVVFGQPSTGFGPGVIVKAYPISTTQIRFQAFNATAAAADPANATVRYVVSR